MMQRERESEWEIERTLFFAIKSLFLNLLFHLKPSKTPPASSHFCSPNLKRFSSAMEFKYRAGEDPSYSLDPYFTTIQSIRGLFSHPPFLQLKKRNFFFLLSLECPLLFFTIWGFLQWGPLGGEVSFFWSSQNK